MDLFKGFGVTTVASKRAFENDGADIDWEPAKRPRLIQNLTCQGTILQPQPLSVNAQTSPERVAQWVKDCPVQRATSAPLPPMESYTTSFSDIDSQLNQIRPASSATSRTRGSARSKGEAPALYRANTLEANGIFLVSSRAERPQHVTALIQDMEKSRQSPPPDIDLDKLEELEAGGVNEEEVLTCLGLGLPVLPKDTILSKGKVKRIWKDNFSAAVVPNVDGARPITTPVPDLCWGLAPNLLPTAMKPEFNTLPYISGPGATMSPFLTFQAKSDIGSLYQGTNQCLGDTATCVCICEALKAKFAERVDSTKLDSTCFTMTGSGTEVRLFVSWVEESPSSDQDYPQYHMQRVKSFAIQDLDQLLDLRKWVRNIVDWGATERREQILRLSREYARQSNAGSSQKRPASNEQTAAKRQSTERSTEST